VPEKLDPMMTEEMRSLRIEPAALIPYDETIRKYDFERRTLLDLPDEATAVSAVANLMSGILKK
jgi:CO dehydrogenase nickel-insertion accessory protein CooC1